MSHTPCSLTRFTQPTALHGPVYNVCHGHCRRTRKLCTGAAQDNTQQTGSTAPCRGVTLWFARQLSKSQANPVTTPYSTCFSHVLCQSDRPFAAQLNCLAVASPPFFPLQTPEVEREP